MNIKILGTGCAGCKSLHANVEEAVKELEISAEVVKEEDMLKILAYNVMKLPALVIDEKVITAGKKLSKTEIKEILQRY